MPSDTREMAMKITITIDQLLLLDSNHVGTNYPGCCALHVGRNLLYGFREPLLALSWMVRQNGHAQTDSWRRSRWINQPSIKHAGPANGRAAVPDKA